VTADDLTRVVVALVLAVALFGMVTRLAIPLARDWWQRQTEAAEAQITALQQIPLPARARHARRHFKAVS
jgi:hypothetical protein